LTTSYDAGGSGHGKDRTFLSRSAEETERIGADLGRRLRGGDCILLSGELGSGKTTFLRGLARGLGIADLGGVHSPSYTLVNHYSGTIDLAHIDAYFMNSSEDLELCGFDDSLAAGQVVAVEWADRIAERFPDAPTLPPGAIDVRMTLVSVEERRILIDPWPPIGGSIGGAH